MTWSTMPSCSQIAYCQRLGFDAKNVLDENPLDYTNINAPTIFSAIRLDRRVKN